MRQTKKIATILMYTNQRAGTLTKREKGTDFFYQGPKSSSGLDIEQ